jgi:hypothetical protein
VFVCTAGRPAAEGQSVHGRGPRDNRHLCVLFPVGECSADHLAIELKLGIKRTKLRLVRCRARMDMPIRERLRDARADKNLDDVPRIPAPWDAEALEQFHRATASH